MTTPTTNFAWGKPVNNADATLWGTELNAIFDAIDLLLSFFMDNAHTNLRAPGTVVAQGAITAAAANTGGGSGPVVANAGLVNALANNGTQTLITLVQGQITTVFATIFVGGGITSWVKADCTYDGAAMQILNKTTGAGGGIDLIGSGANVQVKNQSGGVASINWKVN